MSKKDVGGGNGRLRHAPVVYIRPDSSRVQSPSLSLSLSHPHPTLLDLLVLFRVPVLYNSALSLSLPAVPVYFVVSIFETRYSLDRYASRLSLFCLSNTYSTASRNVGENRAFVVQLQLQPQRRDDLSGYRLALIDYYTRISEFTLPRSRRLRGG